MPKYRLSRLALKDLEALAKYTEERWGFVQAHRYISDLNRTFAELAEHPHLGRSFDKLKRGYRRFEQGTHVVLYRVEEGGVFISRILHQRMLPRRHVIE